VRAANVSRNSSRTLLTSTSSILSAPEKNFQLSRGIEINRAQSKKSTSLGPILSILGS
jgi:hypothetical protein